MEIGEGLLVPLRNVLFKGVLGDTEANKLVVLNVLWLLRVQLSSHEIIIGILNKSI